MLNQAINALTTALDRMPISEVVNLKAKAATVQTAIKELGVAKEAPELAAEAVRRAEFALGKAIRKGQEDGTISKPHVSRPFRGLDVDHPDIKRMSDLVGKSEWNGGGNGHAGINALADVQPEDFDAALAEAKDEGNVSRANVVRKIREKRAPAAASREDRANQVANRRHTQATAPRARQDRCW